MSTDQVVCKTAEAINVHIQEDGIEISHRIKRKRGERLLLAKFLSHKVKSKVYKTDTDCSVEVCRSLQGENLYQDLPNWDPSSNVLR